MKSKEDEAIFLLQNSIDKFSKVRSYATEISRLCDEISLIKSDLPEMSLGEETAVSERILSAENLLEDLIAGVRAYVFHMYWVLTEPEDFSESQSSLPELTSDFFEKTKAVFDVEAVVDALNRLFGSANTEAYSAFRFLIAAKLLCRCCLRSRSVRCLLAKVSPAYIMKYSKLSWFSSFRSFSSSFA